jgi:hypothetical protein
MIKLNAGFSRKVGEPNYGSRGASVNVELELESNLISDPQALSRRIQDLFDIARRSVDQELGNAPTNGHSRRPDNGQGQDRFNRGGANSGQPPRRATVSQVRAIRAICDRRGLNADQVASERFRVNTVEDLTLQEASSLIDELKATPTSAKNGGGR